MAQPYKTKWHRFKKAFDKFAPKGLYARSLLIVIMPMVILQGILTYVFMERHYQSVTRKLSTYLAQNIASVIDLRESGALGDESLIALADQRFGFSIAFMPQGAFPAPEPLPFFSFLDETLEKELELRLEKPFWLDTDKDASFMEIRVKLRDNILQVIARKSAAVPSNVHIFLVWMLSASIILLIVSIMFLRNQIRPVLQLAEAAEAFGKGRAWSDIRIKGAREVRSAMRAFIEMRRRIERQMEQRTTMLAGVSHDLRTMLTRFRLSLALLGPGQEVSELKKDAEDMAKMLEAYMAFARGEGEEETTNIDLDAMLHDLALERVREGSVVSYHGEIGDEEVQVRPEAFKRLMSNLVLNACRHGSKVELRATLEGSWLNIMVDDNGPGIDTDMRAQVFKPFVRLDGARNLDESGSGLGLTIAQDIARSHGGSISLHTSDMGGLRAVVKIPV